MCVLNSLAALYTMAVTLQTQKYVTVGCFWLSVLLSCYFVVWLTAQPSLWQGPHCAGKLGKTGKIAPPKSLSGKHKQFCNFAKTQGMPLARVVNLLILKIEDTVLQYLM